MTVPKTNTSKPTVESVDALVRELFQRCRTAGSDFTDLAKAVRGLHTVLKNLRSESDDPDSPLYRPVHGNDDGLDPFYSQQVTSLLRTSDFTLKQVDTVLGKYANRSENARNARGGRGADDDAQEKEIEIDLVRKEVVAQKIKIDLFLNTIQLHNPAEDQRKVNNTSDRQLDQLIETVDRIAARLFRRKGSPTGETEEDSWQDFKAELEKEGFSSEVLRRNKVGNAQFRTTSEFVACFAHTNTNRKSSGLTSASSSLTSLGLTVRHLPSAASFTINLPGG